MEPYFEELWVPCLAIWLILKQQLTLRHLKQKIYIFGSVVMLPDLVIYRLAGHANCLKYAPNLSR